MKGDSRESNTPTTAAREMRRRDSPHRRSVEPTPATDREYRQPLTHRLRKRSDRFRGRNKGDTDMKSFRKYWETLQNRGDHRTGHRHHFLITFLRRSALALLAFVAVDLATLPPAHALNYDPVCMADCNFLAGGERLQCNIEYERESSGWHECQFIASSNWFGCKASCIQYSTN